MDGNHISNLSRRHFIATSLTAAGGFAIGLSVLPRVASAGIVAPQPWDNGPDPHELDAWIAIEPDDTVLIRYSRSEMGQGSMTALPMMVAEELQCDWSKVKVEYASPNRNLRENNVYGDMSSNGSHSVRLSHEKMFQVGASARERLIAAAAQKWGVQPADCKAANSVVTHAASGRTLRFGELAADAAQIKLDKEPAIKTPDQWTFIGKPCRGSTCRPRSMARRSTRWTSAFPTWCSSPSTPARCRAARSRASMTAPVKGAPGIVQVVKLPNAVAVAATGTFWRAKEALAKLQPEWDFGAGAGTYSEQFAKDYRAALDGPAAVARNDGNIDSTLASQPKVIESVYEVPYLAHAPMEPMNATVHLQPDRLDVWIGTQAADGTTKVAAKIAGLQPEQVYVHNCFVGGGFGRKGSNDEMIQAIMVAKQLGKPVKLVWTREDDLRHDRYRPQAAVRMRAGLGADGMPVAWHMKTAVGSLLRSLGFDKVEKGIEPFAVEGLATNPYKWRIRGSSASSRTRTSRCRSGARSAARTMPSSSKASSMSWRSRAATTPTSSVARCSRARRIGSTSSTRSRRRATGASRWTRAAAAASPSTNASAPSSARSRK